MRNYFILFLTLGVFMATACKKKKSTEPEPTPQEDLTKNCGALTVDINGSKFSIAYDDKGNVTKTNGSTYNYTTTTITQTEASVSITTTTNYTLNNGRISGYTKNSVSAISSRPIESATYTYNSDGYLTSTIVNDLEQNTTSTITYNWDNGNIVSAQSGNNKVTYGYGTEILPSSYISFEMAMYPSYLRKYFGKNPKNLVTSVTDSRSNATYTYKKDDKGNIIRVDKVSKETGSQKQNPSYVEFSYNCK